MDDNGMKFANGITYYSHLEEITAILGEPYQIKGRVSDRLTDATYIWRDESGEHEFMVRIYAEGGIYDCNGMSYADYSLLAEH